MKIKLILLLSLCQLFGLALTSTASAEGRTIVYKNFDSSKKSIALVQDLADGSQLFYEACLTQALINNGYTVMERIRLYSILKELGLDVSGAVTDKKQDSARKSVKGSQNKDETKPEGQAEILPSDELTPSIIKKLGNIYGIKYLGFFGRFYNGGAYLRLVDAETSVIVASAVYYDQINYRTEFPEFDMDVVNIIVDSLESANKLKDQRSRPVIILTKVSTSTEKDRSNIKIISQRKIADKYYMSYIFTDEAPIH